MKKILTLLASIAMLAGVVNASSASAATGLTPRSAPAASEVAKDIASGKLKPVTKAQMPRLKRLMATSDNARLANQGATCLSSLYQQQGRLWYKYCYSSFNYSSSYYGYFYYKNWQICNTSYNYCLAADLYDYYYYYYYHGTWYSGGWYGPYSG